MAADWKVLTADRVEAGDRVPDLSVDVAATTVVLGALATRDWRPMHHDKDFAIHRNGTQDIFLNTPNQAAWIERFLTDWTGPLGRLGRMKFRMRHPVFPGDRLVFRGVVERVESDEAGCIWADVAVALTVGEKTVTECATRVALPATPNDNPWERRGADWKP